MFFIDDVDKWLFEVVESCSTNGLDPEDSIFMLVFFSSLDFEFVDFFQNRYNQISKFSGANFHIFAPTVSNGVVEDEEWRKIRKTWEEQGISVTSEPFALFFNLTKCLNTPGFSPNFFAGFQCPKFPEFSCALRNIVEIGIAKRGDIAALKKSLVEILKKDNIVPAGAVSTDVTSYIEEKLVAPRFFISYSHADSAFVTELHRRLRQRQVTVWLDREELRPGMKITKEISHALRSCDGLIAVLSKHSIGAKWLQYEGAYFAGAGKEKPIIPLVIDLEAKKVSHELPFVGDRLHLDFSSSSFDEGLNKLEEAIRSMNESG